MEYIGYPEDQSDMGSRQVMDRCQVTGPFRVVAYVLLHLGQSDTFLWISTGLEIRKKVQIFGLQVEGSSQVCTLLHLSRDTRKRPSDLLRPIF